VSPSRLTSLRARGLTLSFGARPVLESVDLTVAPGQRIGVVGPNGVGKSTLLRVLAGLQVPDAGRVTRSPPDATVGYLPQEPIDAGHSDRSIRDLIARRTGVAAAAADLERSTLALADGRPGADETYAAALDRWLALGGADLDTRTGEVLDDLGLADLDVDRGVRTLSGGQAARVSLATLLLARFDVFLLDEPTNDLDFAGLERLERFVTGLEVGAVIVSHDRTFLERTVTAVVELDARDHTARRFEGGWTAYLTERETARRLAQEAYDGYRDARNRLRARAQREREWSTQGKARARKRPDDGDKYIRHRRISASEQLAAKAKRTEQAIDRLEPVDKPWEGWRLQLALAGTARSGDVVARLDGAVVERGGFRLGPVTLEIGWAERVGLVGPNGSGKTTLIDALLGRVPLAAGTAWIGPGVVFGEVDQTRRWFATERPVLDVIARRAGLPRTQEVRSLLAKFGLDAADIDRPASELSPGERTRAGLAVLQARGTNCLVLDEPTNHLDLPAIEQLETALDSYPGTLLLVSHDRRLLDAVQLTRVITASGEGEPLGSGSLAPTIWPRSLMT
jgi:ATPase subunit of ABC transporter with duplicated ATPase domains